jgi:hypothetical protein
MRRLIRLFSLPLRAPFLLVLVAVSLYEGLHWSTPELLASRPLANLPSLLWSLDCLHALLVVLVCTMPDILLRRISIVMATSRVMSLVITLLLVTLGGLYLLHLKVLSNLLMLASAVLLARLDLARIRISPPPLKQLAAFSALVLISASVGRWLAA